MSNAKQRAKNQEAITGKISPEQAEQERAEDRAPLTKVALPSRFTQKRAVTLPSVAIKSRGERRIFRFDDKIVTSKVKSKDGEKPANVATVTDMESGEQMTFIVGSVIEANLHEHYPDDNYVGKIFGFRNLGKREGKRYVDFEVVELEDNGDE
jgi:hypothetical protein